MNAARLSRRSKSKGAPGRPLVFTGFLDLVGGVGPLVLTNASDTSGMSLGIAVLAVGLGFLSLRRWKRQMIAVKQRAAATIISRMLLDPVGL